MTNKLVTLIGESLAAVVPGFDVRRFQSHYPNWKYRYGLPEILQEIHAACAS